MPRDPKLTYPTAVVLEALDRGIRYGFDIIESTGLPGGTVYPLLRRLEAAKLVRSRWEAVGIARAEGRPPRKYYELQSAASDVLARARSRYPVVEALPLRAGRAHR